MKISLALGSRGPISRQTAWGCLTSNLAAPGVGSLAAGYRSGYGQLALALAGMGISMFTFVRFLSWYSAHFREFQEPDPEQVGQLLKAMTWPVIGLLIFGAGWGWSLATSLRILRSARRDRPEPPPRLSGGG